MPYKFIDEVEYVYELPKVSDSFKKLFDAEELKDKKRTLVAVFKSTHGGRKTRNDTFYMPAYVRDAIPTWLKDYPKPVLKDHAGQSGFVQVHLPSDTLIGRVMGARYVDLSTTLSQTQDSFKPALSDTVDESALNAIDKILTLQESGVDWEGLGYDELVLEITKPEAIDAFLRNEYATGSSGKTASTVFCSVCGKDFLKDGLCDHTRGKRYDITDKDKKVIGSRKCVWVSGPYVNDEYSMTPFPANEKSTKVSQEVVFKDSTVDYYVYEEEANILNRHDDITKNLLKSGVTLNDALLPSIKLDDEKIEEDVDVVPIESVEAENTIVIPDILSEKYIDWPAKSLTALADRMANTDSKEHEALMQEAEEDVYAEQLLSVKYEKDIKPLLEEMISTVTETKKLDNIELSDEDVTLIVEGINKSILAESARLRLTKKHCADGNREFPVVDKYHAIALRQLIESDKFSVSTKERFLAEVIRLEKAAGFVIPKKEIIEAKSYEDVYNKLTDKEKAFIDTRIATTVDEFKNASEYVTIDVYNMLKSESTTQIEQLQGSVTATQNSLEAEKLLKDRAVNENKLFTRKLSEKQGTLIDLLVDSIIDLKIVNGDKFSIDDYTRELLDRTVESLTDQLRDLRKVVRDEFCIEEESVNNVVEDGGNTTERIKHISPAQLRYLNSVKLKLDKAKKE